MTIPYYQDEQVTLYHGDCREIQDWLTAEVLVTDPPYPNHAGWFDRQVTVAENVISRWTRDAIIFWSELAHPRLDVPLVAVHVWHRTNVNGRPYEMAYQFAKDGRKRRSDILRHAAIFDGVGPGCWEYLGHPTQKPEPIMRLLVKKCPVGVVVDPFAGSGSTLVAARNLGRRAIGVEIEERYCEIVARRLAQDVLALT